MTKRTNLVLSALVLALAGCAADVAPASSSLGDAEMCEPSWQTELSAVDTGATVGGVTISNTDTTITIEVWSAPGYTVGPLWVNIGPDASSLRYFEFFGDPATPDYVSGTIALADAGIGCDDLYKLIVQTGVIDVVTGEWTPASAFGPNILGSYGWWNEEVVCCPPEQQGCTLTQGYWRNHSAWPVSSLTLGSETYTAAELQTLLSTPVRGDASMNLAHQLIAAELNAASGATPDPAIAQAQAWLSANGGRLPFGIRSSSAAGAEAVAIAAQLTSYNEGTAGPGHCGD